MILLLIFRRARYGTKQSGKLRLKNHAIMIPAETYEENGFVPMAGPNLMLRPADLDSIPTTAEAIFGRRAPLVVEIGCGNGSFMVDLATADTDVLVIGAEIASPSATRAYKRISRGQLNNVRLFRGNGLFLLRDVLQPDSVSSIYINFPDPWPRTKHAGRRLFAGPFLEVAASRLTAGAPVFLTTDHADYFAFARQQADSCGWFDVAVGPPPPPTVTTRWAQKWLEMERPIFHLRLTQKHRPPNPIPTIDAIAMQHAHMEGDLQAITTFERAVKKTPSGSIVLLNAYRTINEDSLVFAVLVDEGDLRQEILIEARSKGQLVIVGARRFGSPLGTRGVAEAVRFATEWLGQRGLRLRDAWY